MTNKNPIPIDFKNLDEKYRHFLELMPDAIVIIDTAGLIVQLNAQTEQMFGYAGDELIGQRIEKLMPERFRHAHTGHRHTYFSDPQVRPMGEERKLFALRADGTEFPVTISLSPIHTDTRVFVVGAIRDISRQVKLETALQRRDAILDAVNFATDRFLRERNWERSIKPVLQRLGEAAGVSRVYIFENSTDLDGTLLTSQRYEWTAPGIEPHLDDPKLQNASWAKYGFGRWLAVLGKNLPIRGAVSEFPPEEQKRLNAMAIQSLVVVPIFTGDDWRGFIGFDECTAEREWSEAEVEALKAAAGTIGVATERHRTGEELRQRQAQLAEAQSIAHIGSWEWDIRADTVKWSDELYRIYGQKPEEFEASYEGFLRCVHPEERNFVNEEIQTAYRERTSFSHLKRIVRPDGTERVLQGHGQVFVDEAGAPVRMYGTCQDVTEQHQAEMALRESEMLFRALFDQAFAFIGLLKLDGTVLKVNQTSLVFGGVTEADVVGKSIWETAYFRRCQELRDSIETDVAKAAAGNFVRHEIEVLGAEEMPAFVDYSLKPVLDAAGRIVQLIAEGRDITDKKRVEMALQESQEKYQSLVDNLREVVFQTDAAGAWTFLNPAWTEITGFSVAESLGTNFLQYVHPDDRQRNQAEFQPLIERKKDFCRHESRYLTKDGGFCWIEVHARLIVAEDGTMLGMTGTLNDTTRRKEAEAALHRANTELEERVRQRTQELAEANAALHQEILERKQIEAELVQSEKRFRAIAESIPVPIGISRLSDGEILYANTHTGALLELPHESLIGRKGLDFYTHLDDRQKMLEALERDGYLHNYEVLSKKSDGTSAWISVSIEQITFDGVPALISVTNDITARVRAEEARRQLAAIVKSSEDAILSKDLNGTINSWNAGAERLYGYSPEEAIGQSISMLIPSDREGEMNHILEKLRRGEKIDSFETVRLAKFGELINISLTISPIMDRRGQIIGASAIARDITKQKETEKELRLAKEAAEAANRAKSEFLANMSHELRTPLNAIIGFSEILEDQIFGELNAKQANYIANILKSGNHLLQLINNILDLSKVEAGRMTPDLQSVEIAPLVQEVTNSVNPLVTQKSQTLTVKIDPGLSRMTADPSMLKQILMNLLSNAIKYTPEAGRVELDIKQRLESVEISVTDTGIGIAPEDQWRIFNLFERVDGSFARGQQGTGIGLTLTRQLAELHGGGIWVESEGVGKGSTFTVAIPTPQPWGLERAFTDE